MAQMYDHYLGGYPRTVAAYSKLRAELTPAHEEHIQVNRPKSSGPC
jgi:hypothetical protein